MLKNSECSGHCSGITGTQNGDDRMLSAFFIKGDCYYQGQVAPGIVITIEERHWLLPVSRVMGLIEIDDDSFWAALTPSAFLLLADNFFS